MGQTFFHLLDVVDTKTNHPTAKWFAIRQYANSTKKGVENFQYYGKLWLMPLSIYGNIKLIQEKFRDTIPGEQVTNGRRMGKHRKIGIVPPGMRNHNLGASTKTMYYRALNHQESLWLECMTTRTINAIELEILDEYGQPLKSSTTDELPTNVTITFADVPVEDAK